VRRLPALVPLTHDHHHALVAARRLGQAAAGDRAERRAAAGAFLRFFDGDTIAHFREEEELLFPLLVEAAGEVPEVLRRVLVEHAEIHGAVLRLRRVAGADPGQDGAGPSGGGAGPGEGGDAAEAAVMRDVARRLEGHVHLEERQLFREIERAVPAEALDALGLKPQRSQA
jgi:iron-sulfur cluster repair protein YtfE (RIC family)